MNAPNVDGHTASPRVRRAGRALLSPVLHYFDRRFRDLHVHVDNRSGELAARMAALETSAQLAGIRAEIAALTTALDTLGQRLNDAVERLHGKVDAQGEGMAEFRAEVATEVQTAAELSAVVSRVISAIERRLGGFDGPGAGSPSE